MVVAAHAIMRMGAAYVPVDSELPVQRVESYCDDASISICLAQQLFVGSHE